MWSTVATAFKLALRDIDFITLLLWASIASTLALLPFAIMDNGLRPPGKDIKSSLIRSALLGFLNPFIYYLILFKAYDLMPGQLVQPINYSWPLILALLSVPFLGQHIGPREFGGILISLSGVIVLSVGGRMGFDAPILGIVLAFSSSFLWATYWLINSREKAGVSRLFYNFLFGTIYIVLLNAVIGFKKPSLLGLMGGIYAGVFEMGLAFVLWTFALRYSENTARTGSLVYLAPFMSLFMFALVLDEPIKWTSGVGLSLVIVGILVVRGRGIVRK